MVVCNICSGQFDTSPDSIVLCGYKEGAVHLGCCMYNCSMSREICEHALGKYDKAEIKRGK